MKQIQMKINHPTHDAGLKMHHIDYPILLSQIRQIMEQRKNLTRDQLATVGDLTDFKDQLLNEIKGILKGHGFQQTKKWLKSLEVRKMLNISAGKLQYLRDRGEIPFTKLGGITYYDVDKITSMMENTR
jgi:hypothetical protein